MLGHVQETSYCSSHSEVYSLPSAARKEREREEGNTG